MDVEDVRLVTEQRGKRHFTEFLVKDGLIIPAEAFSGRDKLL